MSVKQLRKDGKNGPVGKLLVVQNLNFAGRL
jgi:hypothetical protein